MDAMAFEPNGPDLWPRIRRELNAYCFDLFRRGALKGAVINEAFFVRCDESTNPRELRDDGIVVAEVGLAAARPYEFIVIRLIQRDGRIAITGANAV
jgi:phage tail sheath protein FI